MKLLTLATNPRQSPDVFDGVIFLISTDENQPCTPSCICGKASYCCKCCRGATDCSHNTPRPRSFYSRATAIKALVEHLAPMPYLVVLAGEREDCITLVEDPKLPSFPESSPKTPIAGNSNLISDGERAFFENCDEKSKSTSQMMNPQTGFALGALLLKLYCVRVILCVVCVWCCVMTIVCCLHSERACGRTLCACGC